LTVPPCRSPKPCNNCEDTHTFRECQDVSFPQRVNARLCASFLDVVCASLATRSTHSVRLADEDHRAVYQSPVPAKFDSAHSASAARVYLTVSVSVYREQACIETRVCVCWSSFLVWLLVSFVVFHNASTSLGTQRPTTPALGTLPRCFLVNVGSHWLGFKPRKTFPYCFAVSHQVPNLVKTTS
jgi:hypothetical protein